MDMRRDLDRKLAHRQPARVPDTHWSKGGDLHGGADPAACEACGGGDE